MTTRRLIATLCVCGMSALGGPALAQDSEDAPAMRWDSEPAAEVWTEGALDALEEHGAPLPDMVPEDYAEWCPDYPDQSQENRAAFWAGLLSSLAEYESTWQADAVGGNGSWFGLLQISPETAEAYGCAARTGSALMNGVANLRCAIRIATARVTEVGTVSRGMRDWGPFHSADKRQEMASWTSEQEYCTEEGAG